MLSHYVHRTVNSVARFSVVRFKSELCPNVKRYSNAPIESQIDQSTRPDDINNKSFENARPFSEIPGMSKFDFLRAFLPGGPCYKGTMNDLLVYNQTKYGDIFRLPGIFKSPEFIVCLNPEDFPIVFRHEGKWPIRRSFDTVVYHRTVHRRDFFDGVEGIISTNGEKWAKARTLVNPILMQPKNAILYLDILVDVNDEFLERVREIRDPKTKEMPKNFNEEINRLTLESIAAVALNTRLGLIKRNRDTEESNMMVNGIQRVFELAFHLEILPSIWKYVSTPKFREQMKVLDNMTDISKKHIDEALKKIENDNDGKETGKEKSVLEKLVGLDKRLAVVMALDMMFAGVDTTSSSLTGILLCIAKNPEKQQKLFEEIKKMLPEKNSRPTIESMRNLPYLRACIKEGMRLYPILPGTARKLPCDLVLSGYHVPKGTEVAIGANQQLRNEKYVPRANEFLPERWLRNDEGGNSSLSGHIDNPFLYIPFGFGPRSCAGKRIVNIEMEVIISRLVRNFNIEFNHSTEKAFTTKFINVPNIPLHFKLEERDN